MATGAAALILILSVYNGFDRIIKDNLSDFDPDILLVPAEGKLFVPDNNLLDILEADPRVSSSGCILQDNVFLSYGERQEIVTAKGISRKLEESCPVASHVIDGTFELQRGDIPMVSIGSALANKLGIRPRFVTPVLLYYPGKDSRIALTNPTAALNSAKLFNSSLFSVNASIDAETVLVPEHVMQKLLGLEADGNGDYPASGIEIRLADRGDKAMRSYVKFLKDSGTEGLTIKDRYAQHPSLYRMMKLEKAAVFLILFFMVILISFNIFGSLSMLMIEKEDDMRTLQAMGADDKLTRRIFVLEGWLISVLGMMAGLLIGLVLAWLQQRFGFVKMPGNYLISAYPVVIKATDIAFTAAGVAVTGLVVASLASVRNSRAS